MHDHGSPPTSADSAKTPAANGGEGGEGGEGSAAQADADARLDPQVRFYRDIQLVRGHLLVGNELVSAAAWADALPHFLHPVEELYDKLAPALKAMDQPAFLTQLKVVVQTVKAQDVPAFTQALARLNDRLDSIDAAVKARHPEWMPFAIETALETMRSALGEYAQSIEGGRFVKAVEYQDARGFVFQAASLLQSLAPQMTAKSSEDCTRALQEIAQLKTAWPSPVPPQAVVLDAASVASAVSRLELALGQFR